ncbi:MAG: ribonuclease H-like domain-containing protein [Stomatobaculum sp.]|nr:ribonuclease H-like domain-containing protein [Stomatobaculum sp.]
MKEFTRPEAVILSYPLRSLGDPDDFLFLDIETTGLTPETAQIYLIGALYHTEESGWTLRQWFADSLSSEEEILRAFFAFAAPFRTLVHYNGTSFDLPFLMRCAAQYGIPHPFEGMNSLDLYRAARPYRKVFGTGRINQKSMEQFLGLDRADRFSGGELISVYQNYLNSGGTALLQQLLLHNEEDVTGLTVLLSLLSYRDFFLGGFSGAEAAAEEGENGPVFRIRLKGSCYLPVPVSFDSESFFLEAQDDCLTISLPYFQGTLLYFYENYRDYYCLPEEDRVVHKSVAEFVDRSAKVKATARTACVKKDGEFFRVTGSSPAGMKLFRPSYESREKWTDLESLEQAGEESLVCLATECLAAAGLRE